MNFKIKETLELIGILSIVGSLIFVGVGVQQSHQISFAEQDFSSLQIDLALRRDISEHVDIWIKGNSGEALDESSRLIYENMVHSAWDQADRLAQARSRLGSTANIAIHEFAIFLYENPGARNYWVAFVEQEQAVRNLLMYDTSGFRGRVALVHSDLEKLDQ